MSLSHRNYGRKVPAALEQQRSHDQQEGLISWLCLALVISRAFTLSDKGVGAASKLLITSWSSFGSLDPAQSIIQPLG